MYTSFISCFKIFRYWQRIIPYLLKLGYNIFKDNQRRLLEKSASQTLVQLLVINLFLRSNYFNTYCRHISYVVIDTKCGIKMKMMVLSLSSF